MKRSKPTNSSSAPRKTPPSPLEARSVAGLRALQRLMASVIMQPLTSGGRTQRRAGNGHPTQTVAVRFIKPNDRLSSLERLEIYNRSYWFRILGCFSEDYQGLRAVLGDRKFDALARAYLAKYPSRSFTLRNLGDRLENFIQEEPTWVKPRGDLALDMARLEWAIVEAFDNEARPAITADELLGRNPRHIRLALQPHLTLLTLRYPLDEFWMSLKKRGALRTDASNAVARHHPASRTKLIRDLKPEKISLAVHRHDNAVFYKRLDREAFQLLAALQRGATLARACQGVVHTDAPTVQQWFQSWSSLGWFCGR